MPRQARLDAPGTLHHVMARGIEKRDIFWEETDYLDFLRRLSSVIAWADVRLFAWALLPNHFHLLLRTGETPLPAVMRRLLTGYAVAFNLRHTRHGHLFQNRYRSIVCEEESYLLELVRYIHLNPLRAGLVDDLEGLKEYGYGGHAALLGKIDCSWQDCEEILLRFGKTTERSREKYEEFVREAAGQGRRPELVGGGLRRSLGVAGHDRRERSPDRAPPAHDTRILGSSEFVTGVLADADWEKRQALRQVGIGLFDLGAKVVALSEVPESQLRSGSKRPPVVAARRAFIQVAVHELGYSGAAVSRYLGVSPSAVNKQASMEGEGSLVKRLLEEIKRGMS